MLLLSFCSLLLTFLVSNAAALELAPITNPAGSSNPTTSSKRDVSFTGDLDLQNFESFYWGAPAGNKLIYANLTVYFPEEYRFVASMERFAGKLKSVQCAEDMMLEFNDNAAFEYAKDVWDWVNNDVNNSFIMVTNHEGCADDMERLPFVVSNMRYDEAQNKAFLTADLKDWEEIAHSYTLNVGNMPLTPAHRLLMERDLVPRGPDFAMDLTSGFDKNLFSATIGDWTTSVDAVVRTVGSLNVDFDIDVDWLKLKSAAMTIQPEDVAASIQLALSEKGTLAKAYNWQKTIITIPIEGISIAKVVKLGAFLDVDVGFTMDEWAGTATANLGARMALSNSAIVKVDLVNSKNNRFSGWTPTFTPIPLTLNAKVEGSAKVYVEPNVKLEASALGKGWSVGLNLQMPYIQADFAAMADSTGVCETKKTLGVDIDARIGVELSVSAATKGNEANPFWEEQLYSNEWPLLSRCLAFGPSNAREGEVADPNPPASKSRKQFSTKTTTAKATKTKTSTSKKPKSTKTTKTTGDATTKTAKTTTKLTLTSTKTPAKSTTKATLTNGDADETDEPTGSKTSKKSSTSKDETSGTPKSSGTKKPSATDSSSSKALHTPITLTTSPTSFSGAHSWTNSSHTRTGTDRDPGGITDLSSTMGGTSSNDKSTLSPSANSSGSDTATPAPSDNDEPPVSSETGVNDVPSGSASSPITPPPSTLSSSPTPTSTPPPSSAPDDTCDISGNGCKDCQDSLDMDAPTEEYFAIEMGGNDLPNPIPNATLAKRETRLYKWVCGGDTHEIFMAEYPTYASRVNKPSIITLSDWYQAADSTDCLNHKITTTSANPPSSSAGQRNWFNAEHVYEGNWIVNFLRYLHEEEKVSCPDMKALFFTATSTNNAGATWAQALMESLGSQANQDLLVFLRKNINGAKFRVFMEGNNIIDKTLFRNEKAYGKMTRIATVGRALDYLAQPQVGEILLDTASNVEDTLNAMAKAVSADARLNGTLKALSADKALARKHRSWLNSFMGERNAFATMQMVEWASLASEAYETETPGSPRATDADGKVLHSNPTLNFLQALQTNPPEGFDASRYAPLLP